MSAPLRDRTLSGQTIETVKATAPVLQQHGLAITTRMYERLFENPEVRALFEAASDDFSKQPPRLAAAILAFAQNIDRLDMLESAVARMAARHVETGVRAEHYPLVAAALLPAIRDVLGDAASDAVLAAWGEAYWFLADILVTQEAAAYAARESA